LSDGEVSELFHHFASPHYQTEGNVVDNKEQFEGFDPEPKSWDFPMIINGWVHKISGAEFKILWYILRHTHGWQKNSDAISYNQFKYGIKRKNGTWLDRGTGLGVSAIKKALKGLVDKRFITRERTKDEKGRWLTTKYSPRYALQPNDKTSDVKKPIQSLTKEQSLTNNKSIVSKADEETFSYKTHLTDLIKSKRRDIHIIGLYWQYKNFNFENKSQCQSALKRELRSVKSLVGYLDDRILETMEWLENNTNMKWTLETIHKFIDEDLANIEPFNNKNNNH